MTVQEIPEPEDCGDCQDARSCSTITFDTNTLTDPDVPEGQSITEYLSSLCQCGNQLVPAITWEGQAEIAHTKLCREHTVRWMQQIVTLKQTYDRSKQS